MGYNINASLFSGVYGGALSGLVRSPLKKAHILFCRGCAVDELKITRRGRPPVLSPEEKEQRRIERNRKESERQKALGWKDQKAYRARHPERRREMYSELTVRLPRAKRPQLDELLLSTGKTITDLILDALEMQYGVNLHADNTEQNHDIPTHQDDE